jgi:ubiquinone/menaquinone biosynthesis C-methylase UbiE
VAVARENAKAACARSGKEGVVNAEGPDAEAETDAGGPDHTRSDVVAVYDRIADHFAKTRAYPWAQTEAFLAAADDAAVGLDVGCGNGRHTELLARRAGTAIGLDSSPRLLETARDRAADRGWSATLVRGDAGALPIGTTTVDLAIYIATIHHLPRRDARVASLDELARVLAPNGSALVSAWATVHDRFDTDPSATSGFDTTIDWTLPGGETVPRYYHIYAPAEFEADLGRSALAVEEIFVASGNCYAQVSPEQ